MHHFEVAEFSVLPIHDNSARAMYHYIATGTTVDDTFYRDLECPNDAPIVLQYVEEHRAGVHEDSKCLNVIVKL